MGLLLNLWEDLWEPIGTKAKEAAEALAEPYLPPPPEPEPYQWQDPMAFDQGMWTDPIPMPETWAPDEIATEWDAAQGGFQDLFAPPQEPMPYYGDAPQNGGFDGLWSDPSFSDELSMWQMAKGGNPFEDVSWAAPQQGYVTPAPAPALYDFGPQEATPIDWNQWDSLPVAGEETVFQGPPSPEYNLELVRWQSDQADQFSQLPPAYDLNLNWSLPVTDYDTMTGEPIRQTDWTVGNRELGSASGAMPFGEALWNGYNRVNDAFAETGLDLTPGFIDSLSGQGVNDLLGGGFVGNVGERAFRQMVPGAGIMGLGSDVAETLGLYKPGTGWDDAAGTVSNAIDSGGNPWEFAGSQQDDLYDRPLAEQLFGQVVFDPTNIVGGGVISKMDNAPDWLRVLDYGIDSAQSAPFKAIGGGRILDELVSPFGKQLGGEVGEASAKLAARLGITAGAGAAGYATGDTEEEKRDRALLWGGLTGAVANADLLARGYGKGLNFITAGKAKKVRFGIDELASRPHAYDDQIFPIPEIVTDGSTTGYGVKATNAVRGTFSNKVQDNPVIRDAAQAWNLLHGKALAVTNELTGSLMQTLDEAAIRIDPETGRALARDGSFMPVFKSATKAEDGETMVARTLDEAADWSDVAEQWWKYKDAGLIDDAQVSALREVDSQLGRIRKQQEAMGLEQPKNRPLWNYNAPEGTQSLYFPRGNPESQNIPLNAPEGEGADSIRVLGRTPGSSKEAKFETAGENIVENNRRYPPLDERLSRYISDELNEIAARGIAAQVGDVPLGRGLTVKVDGVDQPATIGNLLFPNEKALKDVSKQIKPLEKTIREAVAKTKLYTRSAEIGDRQLVRMNKVIADAEKMYGDVTPATAAAATTFVRENATQMLDDAVAVLDTADDMWRTAAREGDEIRRAQIKMSPELRDEAVKIRNEIAEAKKALFINDEQVATLRAMDELGIPGAVPYDIAVLEATRDTLIRSLALRDQLLKANPLEAPAGVASDMKRAEALREFGTRAIKSGKKAYVNAAEEIGDIYRTLGKVESIRSEMNAVGNMKEQQLRRADYWIGKINEAMAEVEPLRSQRKTFLDEKAFAQKVRTAVKESGDTEKVNVAGLMNIELPTDIATTINRGLKPVLGKQDRGWLANAVYAINQLTRPFMTALDASFVGATGTGTMFDQPDTWLRGVKQGAEAMLPKVGRTAEAIEKANIDRWNARLLANELPTLETLIGRYGLQVSTSELSLGQATKDSMVQALKEKRIIDAYGNLPGIKQSQQGFTVAGNVFRADSAINNLVDLKIRNGGKLTADQINSIVTAANSTGGRANRALGQSLGGAQLLGSRRAADLWFAGRFYQSMFDQIGNAVLNGNLEGDLARAAMLRTGLAGYMTVSALNEALGQETEWNPITSDGRVNPNWMRVRFLDQDISPFGAYDSLAKTIMATAIAPEKGMEVTRDFFRQRLSPAASTIADRLFSLDEAKTNIEFGDNGMPRITNAKQLAEQLNPLPLSSTAIAKDIIDTDWGDPRSVAETLFGVSLAAASFKANPMTPTEKLVDAASEQYEEMDYSGTDLTRRQTSFVKEASGGDIERDPLAYAMFKKENPDMVPEPRSETSKAYKAAKDERDADLMAADKAFRAGKISLNAFNERVKEAKDVYRGATKNLEFDDNGGKKGETPQDWVDSYFDIFSVATDGEGEMNWDTFDKEYQKMLRDFGKTKSERDAIDSYIDEYLMKDLPPALRQQKKAYNELDELGYFDMQKYNLKLLDQQDARDYEAEVNEEIQLRWEAAKDRTGNEKLAKPEFDTVAKDFLAKEHGLAPKEIGDVMRVHSGVKYWTPEYKQFRSDHADLIIWFDPKATWNVIQSK